MRTLFRQLRCSIHPAIVDRNVADDRLYVRGWTNVALTPLDLAESIIAGHPYCAQVSDDYRRTPNFIGSDIASLDVDGGLSIAEALQNPIVHGHATFLYTTLRHRPDAPRFRLGFALPRTITDPDEMSAVVRALLLRVSGDRNATDPARLFFGNRNAQITIFNREISAPFLDELIAQGLNPPQPDTVVNARQNPGFAPSRSRLPIALDQPIRLAKGGVVQFSELKPATPIYCPFHHDEHPSAFVVANRHGVNGIHCSACGCTYWPELGSSPETDPFDDFENTVRRAAALYWTHKDYGPLGFVLDLPQASPGSNGSSIRIVNGHPMPPELLPGIMMVRSPKGSGKTSCLNPLLAKSSSVLLIGHRRSLIRQSCNRLNLRCYLDDEGVPNLKRHSRYGICLDSLVKIPPTAKFDIIILDESEQLLAHFLSETMDRGEGRRDRIFVEFGRLIRQAKTVIALDADLGWVTFRTLSRLATTENQTNSKPIHLWLNEAKPGNERAIQVYDSEPHLVAELMQAVSDGKRCYVASNAKGKIEKLEAAIIDQFAEKKTIIITSDTISNTAVQEFVTHPQSSTAQYDVIFASPAIGTGIDIAFPNNAQVIDIVFGFCEAQITTHLDFDQQLARVRHPKAVKVWITPRRFDFETEFEVIRRDVLERSLYKNLLVGYSDAGEPEYNEYDPFLAMAALILSEQRASKNELKAHFIRHKQKQGFVIEEIRKDEDLLAAGKSVLAKGKQLSDENYCTLLLSAGSLSRPAFQRIGEALRAGEWLSESETAAYERTNLELFYREAASERLIRIDDRRRFRARVRLYESAFVYRHLSQSILRAERFEERSRLIVSEAAKANAIVQLLMLAPLMTDGRFDPNAVIQHSDLAQFVQTMIEAKGVVENGLGIEVRSDAEAKPMQQLGAVLRLVGLRLERADVQRQEGRKIYRYRLESESLARMKAIVEARKALTPRQFGFNQYGWPDSEDEEEEDF